MISQWLASHQMGGCDSMMWKWGRSHGDMILCQGHVIGLFRPWRRARSGKGRDRVTGRDVTRPAGDVTRCRLRSSMLQRSRRTGMKTPFCFILCSAKLSWWLVHQRLPWAIENVWEQIYFSYHRSTSPLAVLQDLVTGEIVAGWTELQLSPVALVVFAGLLPGGGPWRCCH